MPKVRFVDVGLEAEVTLGESILNAAERAGAPEGSRCSGVCACSTCHVYVLAGGELLTAPGETELDLLELSAKARRDSSRLGCQARLVDEGSVDVAISEESFRTYLDANPDDRERAMAAWLRRAKE